MADQLFGITMQIRGKISVRFGEEEKQPSAVA
jgi:hypothetical protein